MHRNDDVTRGAAAVHRSVQGKNETLSASANQIVVVHFIGRLIPGGAELRTLELIEAAAYSEFRHVVCVTSGLPGILDSSYRSAGAEVEYLKIKSPRFPLRLVRLLRRCRADVIHSNLAYTSGYVAFLASIARVPNRICMFVSDRDTRRPGCRSKIQRTLLRSLINRYSTQIVGLTPKSLEIVWLTNWREDPRCKIAPRGVRTVESINEMPEGLDFLSGDTMIAHVGRGDLSTKNREKAIRVFSAYNRGNPNSRLVFIGRDGKDAGEGDKYRKAWSSLAGGLGVADRVDFLGEREDIMNYLNLVDGFLFTSTLEGLPGAVLEALSAGLPVVSSRLPGTEFISERTNSIRLLDTSDSDLVWASALLLSVPGRLSRQSREDNQAEFRESPFTLESASARYRNLWRNHVSG